ncbi:septum site-determining protein MinC [Meridianimarinicoccus aquatilis]|uniref:Probable septum site-determining protein MinC n=1 Tax=Meridianimarinicoccus aquatilis TaxID=2552766 RepID=A0A4R6AQW5_9RHOB|nr:septum site-determining protein MinC [Fluviibacterium aquatile]TDL86450.1 septum formation inhibitor MinC [Fluviibacterium aquatile]
MNSHTPTDSRDAAVDTAPAPFNLRSRFITAVVVKLSGPVGEPFYSALDLMIRQAPHFFVGAPLVIDVELASSLQDKADFLRLAREMRNRRLFAIGIQNGTEEQSVAASHAGLLALQGGRDTALEAKRPKDRTAQAPDSTKVPDPPQDPAKVETLIVTDPVRSGQRVFAGNGDLIVVNSVSAGAELVAHGNIHVYGAMRGRALAGVNGDTAARIFCQSLEAELIAISGLYKTSDDFDPSVLKQRTQAYLQDDTLCLDILK